MPQFSPQEIQQTIDVVKGVYASGTSALSPDISKDFTTSLGLIPYNLEPGAKLLAPVITPVRNMIPRNKGYGKATEFKAVTNYNSNRTSSWASEGVSGSVISTTTVDVVMPYKIQALKNKVTFESQYWGAGQVDAKALAVANLLRAFMIQEEDNLLFGNTASALFGASAGNNNPFPITSGGVSIGGSLGTPPAMTTNTNNAPGTVTNLTTGGTIAAFAAGFDIVVTARTGPDYGYSVVANANALTNESIAPALLQTAATTGATSSLVVNAPIVQGAIGYVCYYKAHADANWYRVPFTGRLVISSYTTLGAGSQPPTALTADSTGTNQAFPGVFQQLVAVGSGATIFQKQNNLNGSGNPLGLFMGSSTASSDIDVMFSQLWTAGKADPDMLLVNSAEGLVINRSIGQTPFFVQPDGSQASAVGNVRVSKLANGVTGTVVDVRVHPTLPQGVILALSSRMPAWYPGSDIPSVWSFEAVYDYLELDYPPTDPNFPIEIRNSGALLAYLPLINGVAMGFSLL